MGVHRTPAREARGDLLTVTFSAELHRRMFGDVWRWAGQHRKVQTNIGVDAPSISSSMKQTFDDARFWTEHHTYLVEEIAVRLHHRLRCDPSVPKRRRAPTRMLADVYLDVLGGFGSPGEAVETSSAKRTNATNIFAALRSADAHDIAPLLPVRDQMKAR